MQRQYRVRLQRVVYQGVTVITRAKSKHAAARQALELAESGLAWNNENATCAEVHKVSFYQEVAKHHTGTETP